MNIIHSEVDSLVHVLNYIYYSSTRDYIVHGRYNVYVHRTDYDSGIPYDRALVDKPHYRHKINRLDLDIWYEAL